MGGGLTKQIAEVSRSGETKMDLHGQGLKVLPDEITDVQTLIDLNVSANKLKTLPTNMGIHRIA